VSEQAKPDHIMQVGLGFWASKTLLSAIEMELFTELAKHPEDAETLRKRLGLHERSALDFLDSLVALGFLERREGTYSTRRPRICSSTSESLPTSAASWRWPITACTASGTT
jgi:DNA-binding MarR family transcriptional regulator